MKYFLTFSLCCFHMLVSAQTTLNVNGPLCVQENFFKPLHIKSGFTRIDSQCDSLFILTKDQYRGAANMIQYLRKKNDMLVRTRQIDSTEIVFYKERVSQLSNLFNEQNQHISNMLTATEAKLGAASQQLDGSQKEIKEALKKIEQAQSALEKKKKVRPVWFVIGGALLGYLAGKAF